MQLFGPMLIGGLAFVIGLIVRSQEPPSSWLRSRHWLLWLTILAIVVAFAALLILGPPVTMETIR
jgi:hypothetical protein